MSYATMFLSILFVINLGLFLYSWGNPMGCTNCSPMLNVLSQFTGNGSIDWWWFLSTAAGVIVKAVLIAGAIWLVSAALSGGTGGLTGATSQANPLVVIAISFLLLFAAIPNFSGFGIPEPLGFSITMIFGFMGALALFGILRGNE